MNFQGVRDYRTDDPTGLRQDLQRQNRLVEEAFTTEAGERADRWKVVIVRGVDRYEAKHGEFVLAGFDFDVIVVLPPSSAARAGRAVRVVRASTGFVDVKSASGNVVNGTTSVSIAGAGFKEFTDDGIGGFWGPS